MADTLKDVFDKRVVQSIGADLRAVYPSFDELGFVRSALRGLAALELTPRAWHIAEAMQRHLPAAFPEASAIIVQSLGPLLASADALGMTPFRYLPHTLYVAKYGLEHLDDALLAQYELTQRFTAEFSIRAFLVRHPERTYARLTEWARDPSVHVRRLVSEGTRPRLPWAPRLRAFQEDPAPVLALLELLRDDPERYVQRSVANSLNDIGKDHPRLVVEVCKRWLEAAPPARRWIVSHALRSLVKQGDRGALALLGFGARASFEVSNVALVPTSVRLGDELRFSLALRSTGRRPQHLLIDYAVHFVKANGSTRPKVFKLRKVTLGADETLTLNGKVSFAALTTRRAHVGRHRLELLVNGHARPLGEFDVRA
jgi:3-methyladenine DNA glycosylase AlkC